jgi:hypothetical protein
VHKKSYYSSEDYGLIPNPESDNGRQNENIKNWQSVILIHNNARVESVILTGYAITKIMKKCPSCYYAPLGSVMEH